LRIDATPLGIAIPSPALPTPGEISSIPHARLEPRIHHPGFNVVNRKRG